VGGIGGEGLGMKEGEGRKEKGEEEKGYEV